MKKTLSFLLAFVLTISMIAAEAVKANPEKAGEAIFTEKEEKKGEKVIEKEGIPKGDTADEAFSETFEIKANRKELKKKKVNLDRFFDGVATEDFDQILLSYGELSLELPAMILKENYDGKNNTYLMIRRTDSKNLKKLKVKRAEESLNIRLFVSGKEMKNFKPHFITVKVPFRKNTKGDRFTVLNLKTKKTKKVKMDTERKELIFKIDGSGHYVILKTKPKKK